MVTHACYTQLIFTPFLNALYSEALRCFPCRAYWEGSVLSFHKVWHFCLSAQLYTLCHAGFVKPTSSWDKWRERTLATLTAEIVVDPTSNKWSLTFYKVSYSCASNKGGKHRKRLTKIPCLSFTPQTQSARRFTQDVSSSALTLTARK